jgi:hypothetical protein
MRTNKEISFLKRVKLPNMDVYIYMYKYINVYSSMNILNKDIYTCQNGNGYV